MTQTIVRRTLHNVTAEYDLGRDPNGLSLRCTDCGAAVEYVEWTNGAADYRGDRGYADVGAGPRDALHVCPPRTLERRLEDPVTFLQDSLAPIADEALKARVEAAIREAFVADDRFSRSLSEGC